MNLTIKLQENVADAPETMTEEDTKIDPPLSFKTKIGNKQEIQMYKADKAVRKSNISLEGETLLKFGKRKRTTHISSKKGSLTERNNGSLNMSYFKNNDFSSSAVSSLGQLAEMSKVG